MSSSSNKRKKSETLTEIPNKKQRDKLQKKERETNEHALKLEDEIGQKREELMNFEKNPELTKILLEKNESLSKGARSGRSGVAIANNLNAIAQIGCDKSASALRATLKTYSVKTLLDRLIGVNSPFLVGGDDDDDEDDAEDHNFLDLEKLGRAAGAYSRSVPSLRQVTGPWQAQVKERAAPSKRVKYNIKDAKDATKARSLSNMDKEEVSVTDKRITRFKDKMQNITKTKATNMWELVINPNSFTESIENLFDSSFACKMGSMQVKIKKGVPMVHTMGVNPDVADANPIQNSFIAKMDYKSYLKLIKGYKIEKDMVGRDLKVRKETDSDADEGGEDEDEDEDEDETD